MRVAISELAYCGDVFAIPNLVDSFLSFITAADGMRPPSPSIPERDFTLEALKQHLRIDGRGPNDMRSVDISFGPDLGWVECAIGKTR